MPYWLGLVLGYAADLIAKISGKNLPISSIRIKKFSSSTEFTSAKASIDNFQALFLLSEGVKLTLRSQFIDVDQNREIFFTE